MFDAILESEGLGILFAFEGLRRGEEGKAGAQVAETAEGHCTRVRAAEGEGVAAVWSHRGDHTVTAASSVVVYARLK